MKKWLVALFAAALVFVGTSPARCAEEKAGTPDKPGGIIVDTVRSTSIVQDIDKANRMVTLKGPEGKLIQLKLGDEVKNFDQIEQGDHVVTEYVGSVAVDVQKGGVSPAASESSTVQVAPKGAKPGMVTVETRTVVAVVEEINYKKRTVTLRTPEGLETIKVADTAKRFNEVKKGDNVYVKMTQAVAVSVRKP